MKVIFCIFLALALVVSTEDKNTKFQQIIDNFTQAVSSGDSSFLEDNVDPTALWSAPNQKILRGRQEIANNHGGIAKGHSIKSYDTKFRSEGNLLQAFGQFDYLQENKKTHSGRFQASFLQNREGQYLLTNGIWNLDDSHLKKNCSSDDKNCQQ